METETREIYKCEFCGKRYLRKHLAEYHEKVCWKNPDNNRPCFDCHNISKETAIRYFDEWDGEQGTEKLKLLYCKAKDIYLYPPKVEIKGNAFLSDDLDKINQPMPKTCGLFVVCSHPSDFPL